MRINKASILLASLLIFAMAATTSFAALGPLCDDCETTTKDGVTGWEAGTIIYKTRTDTQGAACWLNVFDPDYFASGTFAYGVGAGMGDYIGYCKGDGETGTQVDTLQFPPSDITNEDPRYWPFIKFNLCNCDNITLFDTNPTREVVWELEIVDGPDVASASVLPGVYWTDSNLTFLQRENVYEDVTTRNILPTENPGGVFARVFQRERDVCPDQALPVNEVYFPIKTTTDNRWIYGRSRDDLYVFDAALDRDKVDSDRIVDPIWLMSMHNYTTMAYQYYTPLVTSGGVKTGFTYDATTQVAGDNWISAYVDYPTAGESATATANIQALYEYPCSRLDPVTGYNPGASFLTTDKKPLLLADVALPYIELDIPTMAYDPDLVKKCTGVYVRVILGDPQDSICIECANDIMCECIVFVGTLGCDCDAPDPNCNMCFPYMVGAGDSDWWGGIAITNTSGTAGTATFTVYAEGDTATFTRTVPAQSVDAFTLADHAADLAGLNSSARTYIEVEATFTMDGFALLGDGTQAQGYLPRAGDCGMCP